MGLRPQTVGMDGSSEQEKTRDMDNRILRMVAAERERQDQKWGGSSHDDTHPSAEWSQFIKERLAVVTGPISPANRRRLWIEIAALAVAATGSNYRNEKT